MRVPGFYAWAAAAALMVMVVDIAVASEPTPAGEPAQPAPTPRLVRPQWGKLPDVGALDRVYPQDAKTFEVAGKATVECPVNAEGGLENCRVVAETPVGWGFGDATLRATAFFLMKPTVEGQSVAGATVRVPLRWTTDGSLDNTEACAVFEAGRPGPDRKARVAGFEGAMIANFTEERVAKKRAKFLTDQARAFAEAHPEQVRALLDHCATPGATGTPEHPFPS